MRRYTVLFALGALCLNLSSCGSDDDVDATPLPTEAGADGPLDSQGDSPADVSPDAADAVPPDAGPDAVPPDAGPDAVPPDAGPDAVPPDAGPDVGLEAGPDAESPDTGPDVGLEAGPDADACPPIDHEPLTLAPIGDIPITAHATGTATVVLHYRLALPSAEFATLPMVGTGDVSATIPADQVTFAGIEYYIDSTSDGCFVTAPATTPEQTPYFIRIYGEKRITVEQNVYEYKPTVYDHTVAFAKEESNGDGDNVYLFDLHTFQFQQVTHMNKPQGGAWIYKDQVVWEDHRLQATDDGDVYLSDIPPTTEHRVTSNPAGQYLVRMHDRIIVWRDDRNMTGHMNGDIYLYDMGPDGKYGTGDDRGEFQVTDDPEDQTAPDVYVRPDGRVLVVWYDLRDDDNGFCDAKCDYNVYLYDSGPDTVFGTADDSGPVRVTSDPNEQQSPVISGHWIVWRDDRDTDWLHPELFAYDMGEDGLFGTSDDGGESKPPIPSAEADNLDIDGNLLVYDDYRDSSYELFLFDMETAEETQLTKEPWAQVYPNIQGKTIVWQDGRNNTSNTAQYDDIYVRVLP